MAVSASTGVMNSLLGKLTTLTGDEYRKLKGVRNKVASLHEEFSSVNALLLKLAEMDELDVQAKVWRDQVRDMSYDIEDCIDDFMHDLEVKGTTTGFLKNTVERLKKLKVRQQIANKIKGIEGRVLEVNERHIRYKLDEYNPLSSIVPIDPRALAIFADAAGLVGIDTPRDELVELLMDQCQELKVASIVGFGGLGKTTLASEVCRKIKGQFTCHAFVSVSLKPDIPRLLQNLLLKLIGQQSSESSSLDDVIRNIREILLNRRGAGLKDDGVAILGGLPSLVNLELQVEEPLEERVHIPGSGKAFPALIEFVLDCCHPLLTFDVGAMPMLKKLVIWLSLRGCKSGGSMEGPLVGIEHLPAGLREIQIAINGDQR
ncbi:hypothetical protein ACQ4PT_039663 [Festuca glaucescens]